MPLAESELSAAIGELIHRTGRMAELGSEGGEVKLDWVQGVGRLLADPEGPERVEAEAREIRERGIRHVIWAGMGGSVMAVQVLVAMGYCDGSDEDGVTIHPLDSTDPAALNRIVERIAAAKGIAVPPGGDAGGLQALLDGVMMIGVAMGMTSEEPITHLEWFTGLLAEAGLEAARHLLVMTLPGSLLDRFARERGAPSLPLQVDGGTGTGGRMSAPATRVFLLPAALWLVGAHPEGALRSVLQLAWERHALDDAVRKPMGHPFVRLAQALNDASVERRYRMVLSMPGAWRATIPWIEQLMEESLGKGGKGVVVFEAQDLDPGGVLYRSEGALSVGVGGGSGFDLSEGYAGLEPLGLTLPETRLSALATNFLGWQLTMALYGYMQDVHFAGQPAVEDYKARARILRERGAPLEALPAEQAMRRPELMVYGARAGETVGEAIRRVRPEYLDVTFNGEPPRGWEPVSERMREIANGGLGVPLKVRRAPAAYHSTEQSEMDGPPGVVSLRVLAREHERCVVGEYTDVFLKAQAVATWQAMVEVGRECFLAVVDGTADERVEAMMEYVEGIG